MFTAIAFNPCALPAMKSMSHVVIIDEQYDYSRDYLDDLIM